MTEQKPPDTHHDQTTAATTHQVNAAGGNVEGAAGTILKQSADSQQPTAAPVQATVTIVNPKDDGHASSQLLKVIEAITNLLKVVAWPALVLLFLFLFYSPVWQILQALPSKVRESNKITVGSLSFEIQQAARAAGNPELAALIGNLSPRAVEELLKIQPDGAWVYASANDAFDNIYIPDEEHKNTLAELEKAGLITFTEPRAEFDKFIAGLQLENAHPDFKESKSYKATRPLTEEEKRRLKSEEYQLTDQGKKAYALIIEGVKQSLNKSADPTATP